MAEAATPAPPLSPHTNLLSARSCEACKAGLEQYCQAVVWSYDSSECGVRPVRGGASAILDCCRFCSAVPWQL